VIAIRFDSPAAVAYCDTPGEAAALLASVRELKAAPRIIDGVPVLRARPSSTYSTEPEHPEHEPTPEPVATLTTPTTPAPSPTVADAARELGRSGGLKGGPARAAKLTPEQRSESSRRAAEARWSGRRTETEPETEASTLVAGSSDRPEWMPPVTLNSQGKVLGAGEAVVAAFSRDERYPLPELARHIYGEATGRSVAVLKKTIENLRGQGRLKRTGATSYQVLKSADDGGEE